MSQMLDINCDAFIDSNDLGTVIFRYPCSYSDNSILNSIRLEIGVLASWTPLIKANIKSFVAEEYPNSLLITSVRLLATTAERTFFEKITILHQEAFRPENSKVPSRYSRHYYDVYCMCRANVKEPSIIIT